MAESSLWSYIKRGTGSTGHWVRIENRVESGTPDVNGCFTHDGKGVDAWIELKTRDSWPKRLTTPIKLPHFTDEQKKWLLARRRSGGRSFLFVRVGREYFLFSAVAAYTIEQYSRPDWEARALAHYRNRVDWEHFRSTIACH